MIYEREIYGEAFLGWGLDFGSDFGAWKWHGMIWRCLEVEVDFALERERGELISSFE